MFFIRLSKMNIKTLREKKRNLVCRNVGKILRIVNKIVDNDRDLVYKIHRNV